MVALLGARHVGKREVKSPKVYLRDSGILHHFLGVESKRALERHPKLGASWEGLLLEAVIHQLGVRSRQCFFWATHTGAELDLLVEARGTRRGFEFKRTTAPRITKSMRSAMDSLQLTQLDVIHAGDETFPLSKRIRAVAASRLLDDVGP